MLLALTWTAALCAGLSSPSSTEIIYDSLCITDRALYSSGIGNYCGGEDAIGGSYDLQTADNFLVKRDVFVTVVTSDSLTHLGLVPKKLCVGFYGDEDDDCIADQQAQHFEEATRIESAPFDDSVYGFNGMRTTAHLSYPPMLRSGSWFGSFQPASTDWGYSPISYGSCGSSEYLCGANYRDGGELNGCCDGLGAFGSEEWRCDCFYGLKISMRIEGIPAGDCVGTERVTAACKPGDGERLGKIVVKVRDGQPNGIVTALLDPPDPRSMSIALDGAGRGKGKFKGVALGEHRVFVCDSIVNVTCAP